MYIFVYFPLKTLGTLATFQGQFHWENKTSPGFFGATEGKSWPSYLFQTFGNMSPQQKRISQNRVKGIWSSSNNLSHEKIPYFPLYWLFNRDPYNDPHITVQYNPLYTHIYPKQLFFFIALLPFTMFYIKKLETQLKCHDKMWTQTWEG